MRVAILQPTYWARTHVWNRILSSDIYVWLDSVKFSRSATKWEDRTIVEAPDGRPIVLRLPLRGSRGVPWCIAGLNEGWRKHHTTITQCYSKRTYWDVVSPVVSYVYRDECPTIDKMCWRTFEGVSSLLQPQCQFVRSSELGVKSSKGNLVLDLVRSVGGTAYISGTPGLSYLPLNRFREARVEVIVQNWRAPVTRHGLANPSTLDLIADIGTDAARSVLSQPVDNNSGDYVDAGDE